MTEVGRLFAVEAEMAASGNALCSVEMLTDFSRSLAFEDVGICFQD
jgi:hypothetical protein